MKLTTLLFGLLLLPCALSLADTPFLVGASKIDISPQEPVRLCGYAVRKTPSEGVAQALWVKAIAIAEKTNEAALIITIDNCAVPYTMREEVLAWLKGRYKIPAERVAICSSHTHSAPCLTGAIPNIFAQPISDQEQFAIDRYTRHVVDQMKLACAGALEKMVSCELAWGMGKVGFAKNRRPQGGPVDHDLPVLRARDEKGKLVALLANYACHCTTLGGDFNKAHVDWAGIAGEEIEKQNPEAVALIAIGCGADSNPDPRGTLDLVKQHGGSVAKEVQTLLASKLTVLQPGLQCRTKQIDLPFDPLPTREQWEQRAKEPGIVGYHAKRNLGRLDRGEKIPTTLPYPITAWNFGKQLAMVFLPGEVVVDYALRLKKELDSDRVWVNGYSNYVPCYIPSQRILREGGYEAETSLWYYDRPARLSPAIEDLIISTVEQLVPASFKADSKRAGMPAPRSPLESLATIRTKPNLEVQLVASEPLVVDPVAIDWGPDGKLWVVEMRDFPQGMDGNWKPGGRVKFLEDLDGDGVFDRATVFLEDVPFPTGITAWGGGVLVCAAPDILYARDTDHDGKADKVEKLFSGFATDNYQARVNSLSLGLDNWIYGANGLIGGIISGGKLAQPLNISGRDFRIHPDTGEFETASGLTQQGRVRDDWGNWFGCDNSNLIWHFPLPEHQLRRNPYMTTPATRVSLPRDADPNQLYPISRTLERFNDPGSANRTTSACGLGLYRDTALGDEFYGNAFTCEPVHNLVRRLVLRPHGLTFEAHKAPDEQTSEFLASRDNWFRPVQVRTGPDGGLYIVDMYRFVVEHPRWITKERLATLDLRAGDDRGRIFRVIPKGKKLPPIRDLTKVQANDLPFVLENSNGTERDRVQLEILRRPSKVAEQRTEEIFAESKSAAVRVQALSVLQGLKGLGEQVILSALKDSDPHVRAAALQLLPAKPPTADVQAAALNLVQDKDFSVVYHLAFALGNWRGPDIAEALGKIAANGGGNPWMLAAVLSSAQAGPDRILKKLVEKNSVVLSQPDTIGQLVATGISTGSPQTAKNLLDLLGLMQDQHPALWQLDAASRLLEALSGRAVDRDIQNSLAQLFKRARALSSAESTEPKIRAAAIRILANDPSNSDNAATDFATLIKTTEDKAIRAAALEALSKNKSSRLPGLLLEDWTRTTPALRRQILSAILKREDWLPGLFAEMPEKISTSELTPAQRQVLLKHLNTKIQSEAKRLFDEVAASRAEVLARFANASKLPGDPAKGALTFSQLCASCHFFRGQGFAVGPNLAALTDKSPQFLMTAILDPNAAVEDRYRAYTIETTDGRTSSGIVADETANSLVVLSAGGARETLLRSKIKEVRASNLSLMPEGLEQSLIPESLADLMAYLRQTPAAFGSASPQKAASALESLKKNPAFTPPQIKAASEKLDYPSWLGVLPMHHCRQTDGRSRVVWQAKPASGSTSESRRFQFPVALGFNSQPGDGFRLVIDQKPALKFNVSTVDDSWQSDDGNVRMRYTVMENNQEDSNGLLDIEISGPTRSPSEPVEFAVYGSVSQSQRWFGIYQAP